MRMFELLEGRDSPLYHCTSIQNAVAILKNGAINSTHPDADEDGFGPSTGRGWHCNGDKSYYGISTTRDPRLNFYGHPTEADVSFVLNQGYIASRYKIEPTDAIGDRGSEWHESEELIVTDSLPINANTIRMIVILESGNRNFSLRHSLKQHAAKYGIPVIDQHNTITTPVPIRGFPQKSKRRGWAKNLS